jgi:ribosomal protein S12 methylthiotransferase
MKPQTFYIFTLGCAKNEFDSLRLAKKLTKTGLNQVERPEEADLVILNTCSFIEDAVYETIETARQLKNRLKRGQKFVVAGCAVNYLKEHLAKVVKADLYVSSEGMQEVEKILFKGGGTFYFGSEDIVKTAEEYETLQEGRFWAYLKVAEGCSNYCSYCLIPAIRGPLKSVPLDICVSEAERLAKSGVKELNLIAQDLSLYGTDLYGKPYLKELVETIVKKLARYDFWLRLMYINPDKADFQVLSKIFELEKVVPYLEIPIQSGSSRILQKMNRKRKFSEILRYVDDLRKRFPDLAVRTTFLVGFPGETETDFEETVALLEELRPDYAYVFGYSDMEGSASFYFDGKLDPNTIRERVNCLSEIASKIMEEKAAEKEGRVVKVLLEGCHRDGCYGRAYFQAPEIDGQVVLKGKARPGSLVKARLEVSSGIDFEGVIIEG